MASNAVRRPLPALISLVALLLLTGLVWWRVINRNDADTHTASKHCTTSTTTSSAPAPPAEGLPKPSAVRVLVLNSTNRTGIAADARTGLLSAGFRSPRQAANFTGKAKVTGVGQIRYGPGAATKKAAALVRYYVPGMTLVGTRTSQPVITVVLGPKYDGVLSSTQVTKSQATARASGSPKPSSTKSTASAAC